MKTTDTFTYESEFGTFNNCRFHAKDRSSYGNRILAIVDKSGYFLCRCTADVGAFLRENEICVNPNCDDSEIAAFLHKMGIISRNPSWYASVGHDIYPIHKLTKSGMELFADNGKKDKTGVKGKSKKGVA